MKISALDRCLMNMDISQNPFLCQMISTSELSPTEIKDIIQLASSVQCQVQLATVVKSGLKSILITIKNSLVTIPALSMLQFVKPENISSTLTFDEHRSIILHARGGNQTSVFNKPIFQQPYFLIAKNMIFSMIVKDVTSLLQSNTNPNNPPPIEQAMKKLDDYFETIPDSPIPETEFVQMENPLLEENIWDEFQTNTVGEKRPSSAASLPSKRQSGTKRSYSSSSEDCSLPSKRPSWASSKSPTITEEQIKSFEAELAEIFHTDDEEDL